LMINPVNDPPVADAQSVTTDEDTTAAVTLTASDVDGDGLTFSVVAGPFHGTLSGTAPNLTYSPDADFNGSDSFSFKANDGTVDSNIATVSITVNPGSIILDAFANSDIFVSGTVSGDYILTHLDDGVVESITERISGGKPQYRYSYLEHKWIFSLPAGNNVTLFLNAWSSGSSDGDSFIFSVSSDDVNYLDMFVVANTSDAGYESYVLPPSIEGTVYVRVTDSNRSIGGQSLDTVYIDRIFIRSEILSGDPPLAPSDLSAAPLSANQIHLDWTDNATDEYGFHIERSDDNVNWSLIDTVGVDVISYDDASVLPNTTYTYRVQTYNGSGNSDYSNAAAATTPSGINLTAIGYKVLSVYMVDLTWSDGYALAYDIFRDGAKIAENINSNAYTDEVGAKGIYSYQVCEANSLTNCSNIVLVDFK
ncbi:MAG: cadherin-like domain-containing protein, partial [Chloroflexi bacterium]|nr:cadherin-like domain-containing protein [Chloroflexota bacterium]